MKTSIPRIFLSGAVVAAFAVAGFYLLPNSSAQTQPVSPAPETIAQPATPVEPPPDISPASPLAQIVRLAKSGVDQSIILNYVNGSTSTFNLDSDKIIYLSDLGVPKDVVNAMMQRDQQLQQQFAAAPPAPAPETAPANPPETAAQPDTQPAPVTVDYFNDTLTPYGNWVVVAGYGRCWQPTAVVYNSSWQPYCDHGSWVYTDCGWYWNSDYAWGATFHYGRWFRDASAGWCWYPDNVWAPSWVTWRYSDNYCGWAPLPPRTYCQSGVGIVYNGSAVGVNFSFGLGVNCFTFVPTQYFCNSHPRNYCVAPNQVTQVYNQTKIINNIKVKGNGNNVVINNGIAVENVAAATKTPIHQVPVQQMDRSFAHDTHGQSFDRRNSGSPAPATHFGAPASAAGQMPLHSTVNTGNGNNHPQNHFPQPTMNQNPPPNQTVTAPQSTPSQFSHARNQTVPQPGPAPAANFHSSAPGAPVQAPPSNYSPLPATAHWPQPETPRNYGHNAEARQNFGGQSQPVAPSANHNSAPAPQNFSQPHNEVRQNYSPPATTFMPQQSLRAAAPATQSAPQNGGGHNQTWGMR